MAQFNNIMSHFNEVSDMPTATAAAQFSSRADRRSIVDAVKLLSNATHACE
jgi:hypothetical protein